VKRQAFGDELQTEPIQEDADLRFQIRYEVLILHLDETISRQHRTPMRHQLIIGNPLSPQLVHIKRKILTGTKKQGVTRNTRINSIPLAMYNLGIGKTGGNQACVQKIPQIFIHQTGVAMRPRLKQTKL
jgi:hypothetical protein